MTTEMWLIAVVRLLGSLPVLRWPFYGALLALAIDQSDLFMMNILTLGGVSEYQVFDKYLDQAYMLTFLAVALRWAGPARTVSIALYGYRLAGVAAFEISGERELLMLFPNFFEYWVILIAGLRQSGREPFPSSAAAMEDGPAMRMAAVETARPFSRQQFVLLASALVALKLFQEYALHYGRWLDGITAVEAVEAIWRFLLPPY